MAEASARLRLRRLRQHVVARRSAPAGGEGRPGQRRSTTGRLYDPGRFTEATIFSPDGHCDYYGSKGFLSADPAVREALLRIPTAELAPATVPAVCRGEETPPALWGPAEWRALEARHRTEPLLDMAEVRRQLASQSYAEDGVAVLRGVMTPEAQRRWEAALELCQELNDRLVLADWRRDIDWRALRVRPPSAVHTADQKRAALGGCQRLSPMDDDNGGYAARLHGLLPEYFPPVRGPPPLSLSVPLVLTAVGVRVAGPRGLPDVRALPPTHPRASPALPRLRACLPGARATEQQGAWRCWRRLAHPRRAGTVQRCGAAGA